MEALIWGANKATCSFPSQRQAQNPATSCKYNERVKPELKKVITVNFQE
jgi:hypothetical protein